jgi:uncharacterized protein (TIGR02328 family)
MRLWHQDLISKLPRLQLQGQHRECCAMRGKGWGKKHSVVNYVFEYPMERLFAYHFLIMREMEKRKIKIEPKWWAGRYRGKKCEEYDFAWVISYKFIESDKVYDEHNDEYLIECLENLKNKGIII